MEPSMIRSKIPFFTFLVGVLPESSSEHFECIADSPPTPRDRLEDSDPKSDAKRRSFSRAWVVRATVKCCSLFTAGLARCGKPSPKARNNGMAVICHSEKVAGISMSRFPPAYRECRRYLLGTHFALVHTYGVGALAFECRTSDRKELITFYLVPRSFRVGHGVSSTLRMFDDSSNVREEAASSTPLGHLRVPYLGQRISARLVWWVKTTLRGAAGRTP
ncbi:uncharacterized protein EV422DRAFT_503271 [Fimicolochytrium jonesii]|uniref:uncharacterized protein n=1 Tax=Fimicolochytrium jonesii TaxID=1396493 RepID=UPI0022FEA64D|nr:uncharacterized protein EV422DRAFT_503271 [Fimicolochytrium jonesii]KAI8825919.1 hypothetical protein EV422DRAFT_503271 [Fimicolochytrium jonesii]